MERTVHTSARRYEIVVRGRLTAGLDAGFHELTRKARPGATALTGDFADQNQRHRVLDQLADLGLEVVSVDPRS
jgi:hypothetical protein